MLSPAKLFRLLTELVVALLGLLLVWLAVSGRHNFNRRSAAWVGLSIFLVYWGLRAIWRADRDRSTAERSVRGGSLVLVGVLMQGITWLPSFWLMPLLGAAGGILTLRGLTSAVLVLRFPEAPGRHDPE